MKNIVLGVTGSIAAYKAAEIASLMAKKGYRVQVIMTPAATEFITPLTMQAVSQQPVHVEMFNTPKEWDIQHISLAQDADLVLVAPATANLIGSVAGGTASNLLTATIMATKAPVVFAPAMNTGMYENPIIRLTHLNKISKWFKGEMQWGCNGDGSRRISARGCNGGSRRISARGIISGVRTSDFRSLTSVFQVGG
jgi:phosphopantothenoylcysteine synthetase/decarboxylase